MRKGQRDKWTYDGFPRTAKAVTVVETALDVQHYTIEELSETHDIRAYEKLYAPAPSETIDNTANLSRFNRLAGFANKETIVRDDVPGGAKTRREETYERLAAKIANNKWFNDNARD